MTNEELNTLKNKRVVLTTLGNVSFAGELISQTSINEIEGCMIRTDSKLGICVWCPVGSIKELILIPIK